MPYNKEARIAELKAMPRTGGQMTEQPKTKEEEAAHLKAKKLGAVEVAVTLAPAAIITAVIVAQAVLGK